MIMVVTVNTAAAAAPYVVTRAICMGGARVEVGTVIELAKNLANELMTAGKVAHYVAPPVPADQPKPVRAKEKAVSSVAEPQANLIA